MHFTNTIKFFIICSLFCSVLFCNFISCKQNDSSSFEEEENFNEPDNTIKVDKIDDKEKIKDLVSMTTVINAGDTAKVTCGDENWSGFYSGVVASQKGVFVRGEKEENQNQKSVKRRAFQKSERAGETGENEEATRIVELSAYSIGTYEVTQELYGAVMGENPSYCRNNARYPLLVGEGDDKDRPVENVSWYNAVAFCNELTRLLDSEDECVYYSDEESKTVYKSGDGDKVFYNPEKKGYRLPTEAEWEFAARGGNGEVDAFKYAYAGGNSGINRVSFGETKSDAELDKYGWYKYNLSGSTSISESNLVEAEQKGYGTHVVGKKTANTLGIFDMSGNVREWCYDKYDGNPCSNDKEYIEDGVLVNPRGPATGTTRVARGGSYLREAYFCSVAYRASYPPDKNISSIGFRLAKSL